jgi:hypothetical protein
MAACLGTGLNVGIRSLTAPSEPPTINPGAGWLPDW